jgi:hypothetical protein
VGRAILPADRLSSRSSRLEKRLRPRLVAPRRKGCGIARFRLHFFGIHDFFRSLQRPLQAFNFFVIVQ